MILGNEIERRYFSIVPSYMYYDCLSSDCLLGGIDQFNLVFIHNLFGLRRITIGDENINTAVNRCYVFYPLYPYIHLISHSSSTSFLNTSLRLASWRSTNMRPVTPVF